MPLFSSPRPANCETQSPTTRRLQVFVLFNGHEATVSALRTALAFVEGLGGEILIASTQLVPYPLPLDHPSVDGRILLSQICDAISESGMPCVTPPKVLIAYARDCCSGWHSILPPHCIVVVGRAKRSLRQRFHAWRAAKSLGKMGFEVLLA